MSLIISHRGNISGADPSKENHPDQIKKILNLGFQVEIDVWFSKNKYFLGHDAPQYQVDRAFLSQHKLWCHAKNLETLHELKSKGHLIHCFFHDKDDATLTSQGYIWTLPGKPLISNRSIAVLPEKFPQINWKVAGGVCTDYIEKYKI